MTDKKYLKWYNKVGYGSGDIAGNVVYALLSSFVMIYLTDTVGLNAGIVGTLIAVSKIFDGISDIFFGALIDKTKTKMGKARPWMLYGYFGCAICLIAIFCIPTDMGQIAQYAWFFITYTLLNAGFYTANNIAYSALTALITRNNHERVQMGSIRFMFAFGTSMLIQVITVDIVNNLGGGADAWRTVAIVYAIIGVISNTISVFSVKEFSQDEEIFGVFAWAINIPMIAGLLLTPILVKKLGGMYRLNIVGYIVGVLGRMGVLIAGYMGSIPIMLAFTAVAALGMSPLQGDMNALIATTSEYTRLTTGKKVDGIMYSCTSFGTKVGGGIGTAIAGWLLAASGYVENAAVQSESCLNMLHVMYLWLPMIFNILITIVLIKLNVEKTNAKIKESINN